MRLIAIKIVAMTLALTSVSCAITLLLLSGWFLSASALAGLSTAAITFNYVIPSATIRLLAFVRIMANYGENYVGHNSLLSDLNDFRLRIFSGVMYDNKTVPKSEHIERIDNHTNSLANRQFAYITPIFSACSLAFGLGIFIYRYQHTFFVLYCCLLTLSIIILFCLYRLFVGKLNQRNVSSETYRHALSEYLTTASIWSLSEPATKTCRAQEQWLDINTQIRKTEANGDTLISALAFISVIVSLTLISQQTLGYAPIIIIPLLFLTFQEWFGFTVKAMRAGAEAKVAKSALGIFLDHANTSLTEGYNAVENNSPDRVENLQLNNIVWLRETRAGSPISLQAFSGQRVLITGDSGCGKSSLLLALAGLIHSRGQVIVDDINLPLEGNAVFHYSAQNPLVLSDTLRFNLKIAQQTSTEQDLKDALDFACLSHLKDHLDEWLGEQGRQLSGGEKKRLGLARAYLTQCPVWMLDEPFEGLDKNTQTQLLTQLGNLRTKPIIFVVSHKNIESLIFDHVISLEEPL